MYELTKKIWKMKNPEKVKEYWQDYYNKNRESILKNAKKRPKKILSEDELAIKKVKHRIYMKNYRAKNGS